MCYVGKATKIFIFIVSILAMVGLILGYRFLRHGHHIADKCANGCRPVLPDTIPATTSPPATLSSAAPPYSPSIPVTPPTPGPVHV